MTRAARAVRALGILLFVASAGRARAADLSWGVEGGYFDMSNARQSARAVFDGSAGGPTFGTSLRLGLGHSFFVGGGVRFFDKKGQRVFVADKDSPVFPLGHPLEVRIVPVYAMVGYRLFPTSKLVPYLLIAGGSTSYRETSTVGGLTETETQRHASGHVAAGVDYAWHRLTLGAEAAYSSIPNTIGLGGVSQVYGEDDVGGLTVMGTIRLSLGGL